MSKAAEYLSKKFAENDKNGGKTWTTIFQGLVVASSKRAKQLKLSTKVAFSVENVEKNRYRDISPYDTCRIILGPDGNYINASPLDVKETGQHYILCQGPLEETSADFWQMIWEQGVPTIVMLNRLIERGTLKCAPYLPSDKESESMVYAPFTISCDEVEEEDDYTVRRLSLSKEGDEEIKKVTHLQYMEWPDFGVPRSPSSFLHFLNKYWQVHGHDNSLPSVVHCSAGVGRSGTFVLVDTVIRMVEKSPDEKIDVEDLILKMRDSRMGLIQTPLQLRFSWHSIVNYLENLPPYRGGGNGHEDGSGDTGDTPAASKESLGMKRDPSPSSSTSDNRGGNETDETLAKRRAMISRMVARSRATEAAAARPAHQVLIDLLSEPRVAVASAVAGFAIILYYYMR